MKEINEVIKQLRSSAKESLKGKYRRDWATMMFQVYVLKLLMKSARFKETLEQVEQEAGEQRFYCKQCKGTGFTEDWDGGTSKRKEDKIIEDCSECNGEGFIFINVIDKRKNSKNKVLEYNDEY